MNSIERIETNPSGIPLYIKSKKDEILGIHSTHVYYIIIKKLCLLYSLSLAVDLILNIYLLFNMTILNILKCKCKFKVRNKDNI